MFIALDITSQKYFQTTGDNWRTFWFFIFIYICIYIICLPLMKAKSARSNVKVDNNGGVWNLSYFLLQMQRGPTKQAQSKK